MLTRYLLSLQFNVHFGDPANGALIVGNGIQNRLTLQNSIFADNDMLFNNTQVRFSYCGTSVTTHVTPNSHLIFRALLMNYSLSELVSWWKQVDRLLPITIASSEMQSVWPQLQVTFRMLLSARTLVRIVLALCVPFSQRLKTASSSSCTAQPATAMMRQTCVEPTKLGRPRFHQRTIRRNLRPCFPQPRHLPCCHPNSPP